MTDSARSGRILLLLVLSLFVTGCPGDTARQAFDRAESHKAQRRYSQALGEYQRALSLANKEQLNDFASQIQTKISEVRTQIEELATEEVRAHMRDAERHANARNWSGVLNSLERARRGLEQPRDRRRGERLPPTPANEHLRQQLATVMSSDTVKLAQTAQVYARMSREASWSNWMHWLRGDDWFTFWGEMSTSQLSGELRVRAERTRDQNLIGSAGELSTAWDRYWLAKVTSRNNDQRARPGADDPTWVHVLSGVGDLIVAGNEAYQGVKFDKARQRFEGQLDGALARARYPTLDLHPPAAPAAPAPATPAPTPGTIPVGPGHIPAPAVTSVTPGGAPGVGPTTPDSIHGEDVRRTP